jgi:serine/threonine protein kinase/class 3 adenylate cyclase
MPGPETRFAVLLFTDLVGSTELKARYGVPAYTEALRTHNAHFERLAHEHLNVRTLQNRGDGFFAEVGSIAEAVRFALLFQAALREEPWSEVRMATRIGIHAGEVGALDQGDGTWIVAPAADLAARIADLAMGGQILLTRFPFDEARHFIREHPPIAGKPMPPLRWLAHGPYLLKGRDEPMDIFEVGAEGLAPLTAPPDGEKAKRAIRPGEEETLGWRPAVGLEIPGRTGWHLTEKLGAGGFGEVWVGEHAKLPQRRAFKFCFDDERLRALKREVTLVRLLRSALGERDDIVHIHELKLDAPPFYLESDLAPHGNLLQWAESQGGLDKIPLAQRIALVAHTATALAAAHSIGVLHKDIKPTNILIFDGPGGEPRPRLVDFGIGTLADPDVLEQHGITDPTRTVSDIGGSTGTPTYSPPEYLAGKPYTIQGDIYCLGVLLYQLAAAKPNEPLAPGWERDIADPLLREDIANCVDGDPTRRFQSAALLATQLHTLAGRQIEIRRAEEAAVAAARRAVKRERIHSCLFLLAIPALVATILRAVTLDKSLAHFVACMAILWFGCTNILVEALKAEPGGRVSSMLPRRVIWNWARILVLTVGQTFVLYIVLHAGSTIAAAPMLWQMAALLGLAWSTVGLSMAGQAISRSHAGLIAFLSVVLLPQLIVGGYAIPGSEMTDKIRKICRFTPAYAAQVVMDTSFLWQKELDGELLREHGQSYRNLDPDRELSTGDIYSRPIPAVFALLTEFAWGLAGGGIAIWAYRRRTNR